MRVLPTIRRLAFTASASLLGALPGAATAEDSAPPFLVRDTRAAQVALDAAARDLAGADPRAGLLGIRKLLDTVQDDLVADGTDAAGTRWISAPEAARRLLLRQPASVREAFEALAAPPARALLARAAANRDERALADVVARFLPSTAAVEAAVLLAESLVERGAPLDATVALRRALAASPEDPRVWGLLVDALEAGGDAAGLRDLEPPATLLDAPAGGPAAGAAPPPPLRARLDAARARTAPGLDAARRRADEAARTALGGPERRLASRHWTAGVAPPLRSNDVRDEPPYFDGDGGRLARIVQARVRVLTPLVPAPAGRSVVVGDGFSLAAYDVLSGRRIWRLPDEERPIAGLPVPDPSRGVLGRTPLDLLHEPVVADGTVFGVLETITPYVPRDLSGVEITTYRPRRVLVAADVATGALRWRMGASRADALALAGLSAASEPVVADGICYAVLAGWDRRWRVHVAAFDAERGELRWIREVVGGQQELNLFGEPVHELLTAPPAVADGTIYATTGLGVVVALEARAGAVRWVRSVRTTELERVEVWFATPIRVPTWAPAPVRVRGDAVVCAPSEGPDLVCLERSDGRVRWSVPSESRRESATVDQVVGVVHDGRRDLVVVTGTTVRGIALQDGKVVWREAVRDRARVAGRAALTSTSVHVPTTAGLSVYSVRAEGRYVGEEPWPRGAGPGNVVLLGDALIVAGRGSTEEEELDGGPGAPAEGAIQAFFDRDELEARIAARRAEHPDDPAVALDEADLARVVGREARAEPLYEEGRRLAARAGDEALLERARRGLRLLRLDRGDRAALARDVPAARTAYEAALAVSSSRSERFEVRARIDRVLSGVPSLEGARVRNLEALAKEAGDASAVLDPDVGEVPVRVAARISLAALHVAAGRPAEAVDALQAILVDDPDAVHAGEAARIRATREIAALVGRHGADVYARHEREAKRRLEEALAGTDPAPLRRVLETYPNATVVPGALLGLGERLAAGGEPGEAAAVYRRFLASHAERPEVPTTLARLARALAAAGQLSTARATLLALERRHGEATIALDGTSTTGAAFARAERDRLGPLPVRPPEPPLSPPLSVRLEEPIEAGASGARVFAVARAPDIPATPPVLLDVGADVIAIDGASGTVRFRRPWGGAPLVAAALGDAFVCGRPGELVAIDARTGLERWRKGVSGQPTSIAAGLGQAIVARRHAGELAGTTVTAYDPVSAAELWSRTFEHEPVDALLAAEEAVLVVRRRTVQRGPGASRSVQVVGIHSLLTGEPVKEILCAADAWLEATWRLVDSRTLVTTTAGEKGPRLDATDVGSGRTRWTRSLDGFGRVRHLLPAGDAVAAISFDGRVTLLALATGEPVRSTRIAGGVECVYGTEPFVDGDRLVAFLRTGISGVLSSFDLTTGRAAWTAAGAPQINEGWLGASGRFLVTIEAPPRRDRNAWPAQIVNVFDAKDGTRVHRITGEGLVGHRPTGAIADGALVVAGIRSFAVYR